MEQLNIFDQSGPELRDAGIKQAITHADDVNDAWSDKAYYYLTMFVRYHQEPFMAEDFRAYCEKYKLPTPPHLRAYGSVMMRAARNGIITKVGFQNVSNAKAHCTPAAVWEANK